jgi:hypothetical protein
VHHIDQTSPDWSRSFVLVHLKALVVKEIIRRPLPDFSLPRARMLTKRTLCLVTVARSLLNTLPELMALLKDVFLFHCIM